MRLDKKFVVVVGISLGWALLVSAAFYRMAKSGARPRPASPEKDVVVATQALEMGAVIKVESIKLIRLPDPLVPKGAFSKKEDVLDRPVISPIQPDEPILEARLAVRGSGGGVAPLIPPGMRAISVRVNEVVGVAGFVLPGMRVDVLVTGRPPGHDDTMTTTVLQNISVLSVGQTLQVDANNLGTNKATWNTDAAEGTQCLIHTTGFSGVGGTCPDPEPDCFDPNPGAPVAINGGSMNPNAGLQSVANISRSDSIVTAPIFDGQHNPCSNYSISGECDSTPANVQVIGFLQLGIQSVSAAGDVTAVILNAVGCNPSATGTGVSGGGVSVIPVRLIQP